MDKVFSARMDEKTIKRIDTLAHRMHKSKKKILEEAIDCYCSQMAGNIDADIIAESSGAWQRDEDPSETASRVRKSFNQSMHRGRREKP